MTINTIKKWGEINLQPLDDKVFIKPFNTEVRESGLILKDDTSAPTKRGIIMAIGLAVEDPVLEVGQTVFYHAPAEWPLDIEDLVWVRYEHLLAIIKEEKPYGKRKGQGKAKG